MCSLRYEKGFRFVYRLEGVGCGCVGDEDIDQKGFGCVHGPKCFWALGVYIN